MKVKMLKANAYTFSAEFVGQVLPAKREGYGVRVTFPREVTDTDDNITKDHWYYSVICGNVEIVEE